MLNPLGSLTDQYRRADKADLPPPWKYGLAWEAFTLNAPAYLTFLAQKLRSKGVPFVRHRLSALDEAYDLPKIGQVELVINASGLGARSLLGVEDSKVYPARGQTVLVKAPNVRTNYGCRDPNFLPKGESMYIIPRPSPEGHVILGGTFLAGDWSTLPDPKVAERILKNAYNLCPALSGSQGWEKIEVVKHNVGLRPCREGGARIELEKRTIGEGKLLPSAIKGRGRKVAVVHAYGIGPAG
jgi:glycine/D-amino acid oxidase-like deaminating enzyme